MYLVTGSAGHLGEALVRVLRDRGDEVVGVDLVPSAFTGIVGSITDRDVLRAPMRRATHVIHAATLHKPHVESHAKQAFVDTNIAGTLALLELACEANVKSFVFTSTTSAFGRALTVPAGAPAAWITEDVVPVPKNIYGVTKVCAEEVCELVHRQHGLPVVVLRTSRFFPEADDRDDVRTAYEDGNLKANEYLYRRADVADIVDAHLRATVRAGELGFGRYIVSATTPFARGDAAELGIDAPAVVARYVPGYAGEYVRRGWRMFPTLDRVYDNSAARRDLGWAPHHDFARVVALLAAGEDPRSPLARAVGAKGYHAVPTGVYTTAR